MTEYETMYCCGEPMEYAGGTTIIREEARWTATTALPNATQETQDKMVCRVCGRMCWVTRG
jgi:hypothetical protein